MPWTSSDHQSTLCPTKGCAGSDHTASRMSAKVSGPLDAACDLAADAALACLVLRRPGCTFFLPSAATSDAHKGSLKGRPRQGIRTRSLVQDTPLDSATDQKKDRTRTPEAHNEGEQGGGQEKGGAGLPHLSAAPLRRAPGTPHRPRQTLPLPRCPFPEIPASRTQPALLDERKRTGTWANSGGVSDNGHFMWVMQWQPG